VHREDTVRAFTEQAESYHGAAVTRLPETLDALIAFAAPQPGERWLDVACGTGAVSRALAGRAGSVVGVDATPAMLEVARRETAAAGLSTVEFTEGDATRLAFAGGTFDGAVCRFAFHHLAVPGRVLAELARVVRPGGVVVVADQVGDEDVAAFAWSQTIERLRDPSIWLAPTPERLRRLGEGAGLRLERESSSPFSLGFADWLARGTGSAAHEDEIRWAFAERPQQSACFRLEGDELTFRLWMGRWRR